MSFLLVGALLVLLLFAGVDALRSWLDDDQRPQATTQQSLSSKTFPPCKQQELEAAIEVRGGIATTVIRYLGATACHRDGMRLRLTIWDRAGRRAWHGELRDQFERNYARSPRMLVRVSEATVHFLAPNSEIRRCYKRGPFVARAHVGPYVARTRGLSANEIGCP